MRKHEGQRRWLPVWAAIALGAATIACNLPGGLAASTSTPAGNSSAPLAATVQATSSILTATPAAGATGNGLPRGTLILTQLNNPIAQLPNGPSLSLKTERFGSQASIDGRYGARFVQNKNAIDLSLVDFSATPEQVKEVPQGKNLTAPGITWKEDSSGFAFYDLPVPENIKTVQRGIFYFEVASGQTRALVPAPAEPNNIVSSIAFSPDGKYLVYAVSAANTEAIGGPDAKLFLLDLTSNQTVALPAGASGFYQWLRDGKGFLALRLNQNGTSQLMAYDLANLAAEKVLTPANLSDLLADLSPDGRRIVVSSALNAQQSPPQLYVMNVDGSSRRVIAQFPNAEQSITALVWATDGIYYSLSGENTDTTWRVDLDGANPTKVAEGTLQGIVGLR